MRIPLAAVMVAGVLGVAVPADLVVCDGGKADGELCLYDKEPNPWPNPD
ncbi:hypothetical protein [Nonomuraea soli]|uniref:Uncharacterized protein n=1 Tax=Nonomuraea soli TaxID=1032476 RepID=A0A7W0CGM5_9ACTN|nr:hypothetical protein [Nonomuraea soli]MBA2890669.1 hypothetical protein [Nonomuraea soli]